MKLFKIQRFINSNHITLSKKRGEKYDKGRIN